MVSFLEGPNHYFLFISFFPTYMPRAQPISSSICRSKYHELVIMQFFPVSCHFLPLRLQSPSAPCPFLSGSNRPQHPVPSFQAPIALSTLFLPLRLQSPSAPCSFLSGSSRPQHPVPSFQAPIALRTLFSNTLSLCSSPGLRNQVSHPHGTAGRNVFLYVQNI